MGTASTSPDTMEAARLPGLSITVEKNPPEARLLQLGVKSWPKYIYYMRRWGCPPGRFPLKFDAALTCYLVKGRVRAAVKGSRECVEFGAGDLVVFPKGLSCTWDVVVGVDKHYNFDPS
ncbi:Enzyme of the cupin superfamily [Zea mays]|uniref:Enzyme of the cupin superfamily n=1 Tax=Zea mays TaxID=4577 RepID=A0A1D6E619_MAIZE|nr:Enzyme of the cupin superfamily [Zea mays]